MTKLNFVSIKKELEAASWETNAEVEGMETRRVYLGSMLHLCPSGKVYTPWAPGTVTEAEVQADNEWYQDVDEHLSELEAYLETGEGDPCDLFAVQARDVRET